MNDIFEKHFKEQGFTEPTLIQKEVYPLLAQGKDVLGLSPTGSGKTLAYALPLLEKVLKGDGPQLLIIAPSQELAAQLADVIRPWGRRPSSAVPMSSARLKNCARIDRKSLSEHRGAC